MNDLTVFQLLQFDPGNTAFAPQDQTVGLFLFTCGENRVHQTVEALRPNGLELIKVGAYRVGLYREFRR